MIERTIIPPHPDPLPMGEGTRLIKLLFIYSIIFFLDSIIRSEVSRYDAGHNGILRSTSE